MFKRFCILLLASGVGLSAAPARFLSITRLENGGVELKAQVESGRSYLLQASIDLKSWAEVLSATPNTNLLQYVDSTAINADQRFFRLVEAGGTPNDQFANRLMLTGAVTSATGGNLQATQEPGEPAHSYFDPGGRSVWWSWTAPADGLATVDTIGSYLDTLLAVYTGNVVSNLTQVAKERFLTKQISFPAVAGQIYHLAVDGAFQSEGTIRLNVALTNHPGVTAPSAAAGVHVFLNETSDPNVPLRVIKISADGRLWSEFDNGATNALEVGRVISYTATGNRAVLELDAERATETNRFEYAFTFVGPTFGEYTYKFGGQPFGAGTFADFRPATNGLAPPALARAGMLLTRAKSSTGVTGQSHYFTAGLRGEFHDADVQEQASGRFTYTPNGSTAKVVFTYEGPADFRGDRYEIDFQFASTTHGTFVGRYFKNDGAVIDIEGPFLIEYEN